MKKLLLLFISSIAFTSQAQQELFFTEDCQALTIGNVASDLTGTTAGQGNWYTFTATNAVPAGTNSDYQVVNDAASSSQVFQVSGSSGATGSRYLSQDISANWTNRVSGNDIVQLEYDFYTGSGVTTSMNTFRTYIYNSDGTAVAGYLYNPATLTLSGWAYYDNTATVGGVVGYYTFNLISGGLVLTADTWYKLGVAYDYNTGDIKWKDDAGNFYTGVTAAIAGVDITEFDFAVSSGSVTGGAQNTASNNFLVDNIKVTSDSVESLLGIDTNSASATKFLVYPNPTKNVVNITNSSSQISTIEITDLNGRVVKQNNFSNTTDAQINISDLSTGVYMMKIISDNGTTTKKIIKE